jgi:predicted O-methyltransferase YrrM
MGVRYVISTWAFAEGLPVGGKLLSIDIKDPSEYGGTLSNITMDCREKGIDFKFKLGDTLDIKIPKVDLLFIDTDHTYKQLSQELELHSDKAQKYIVLHDTVSCADELLPAVNELIEKGVWKIEKHYENCNGLMVLSRV